MKRDEHLQNAHRDTMLKKMHDMQLYVPDLFHGLVSAVSDRVEPLLPGIGIFFVDPLLTHDLFNASTTTHGHCHAHRLYPLELVASIREKDCTEAWQICA